ncbi:UDP-glucuronosyltransferase 2B17-like isoform X1 [Anopheles funestus]|uniref:UDP-glucuronosyltransferase 2B17-like precursor n=1 Tax=Anopheles funestus TaxID=62324 RepID=UPI0020C5BB97|nr:UDP-glucuronosyltransferase 2B17-like precursor [Anopheles funestus]
MRYQAMKAVLAVLLVLAGVSQAANILFMSGVPSPSHYIWLRPLMYEMGKRGHNVTVLSADIEKPPANVTYIHLENFYSTMYNTSMREKLDFFELANQSPAKMLQLFDEFGLNLCEAAIKSEGLHFLLRYPKEFKFDLFVSDFMIGPCIPAIIMHRFKDLPFIPSTPYNAPSTSAAVLGSFAYPGLVPNHVFDAPESMSFVQRVKNFYFDMYEMIIHETFMHPEADKIVRKLYPDAPSTYTFYKNVRLSLANVNPVIQYKEPMMPSMIPVGGLQIMPSKPLPDDLRKVVEGAKNGFILFSLGSNARSDLLGQERIRNILNAMERLSQYQFLWKFESDESKLPVPVPKNVYIRAWMPQNDLLAHPNIKLFITHSGLLSTQEAIWHGVPIIGFPVFADQFRNINYCVGAGIARRLSIQHFQANELVQTVKEMLGSDNYSQKMKQMSRLFRDQPESPLERAAWWCEWVLRNPDSNLLQSRAVYMSWFQKYSYDVITFVLGVILLLGVITWKVINIVSGRFLTTGKKSKAE